MQEFRFVGCGRKQDMKGEIVANDIIQAGNIVKEKFKGIYDMHYNKSRLDAYYRNGRKAFVVFAE